MFENDVSYFLLQADFPCKSFFAFIPDKHFLGGDAKFIMAGLDNQQVGTVNSLYDVERKMKVAFTNFAKRASVKYDKSFIGSYVNYA